MKTDIPELYVEHKLHFWMIVLGVIPLILIVGSFTLPEIFWDGFLWRYFWGPVKADAAGRPLNGISAGYNWVNTTVYGISLAIAFLGIYEIIEHYNIEVDRDFVLSLLPFVVLGGSLRTLEDAGLFSEGVEPFFISPIIYFVLGSCAILTMLFGAMFRRETVKPYTRALILLPPVIGLAFMMVTWWVILLVAVTSILFFAYGHIHGWMDEKYLFLAYGTSLLTASLAYNVELTVTGPETYPWEWALIIALTLATTSAVLVSFEGIYKLIGSWFSRAARSPLNILIVFAHMLDASATYRGISAYGYVEKQVIPALLIDITGTSLVMYVLKIGLIIFVIYVLDSLFKEELSDYPQVVNLLKFVVIVLGLAPGIRNMLRLTMGV